MLEAALPHKSPDEPQGKEEGRPNVVKLNAASDTDSIRRLSPTEPTKSSSEYDTATSDVSTPKSDQEAAPLARPVPIATTALPVPVRLEPPHSYAAAVSGAAALSSQPTQSQPAQNGPAEPAPDASEGSRPAEDQQSGHATPGGSRNSEDSSVQASTTSFNSVVVNDATENGHATLAEALTAAEPSLQHSKAPAAEAAEAAEAPDSQAEATAEEPFTLPADDEHAQLAAEPADLIEHAQPGQAAQASAESSPQHAAPVAAAREEGISQQAQASPPSTPPSSEAPLSDAPSAGAHQQVRPVSGADGPPPLTARRGSADSRGARGHGRRHTGSMDGSAFPAPMPMSPYSQVAMPMAPGMMLPPGTPPHGGMMPVYPNPFGYYQMPYPGGMYWPYDPSANAMGSPMGGPSGLDAKFIEVNQAFMMSQHSMAQQPMWHPLPDQQQQHHPHPHHRQQGEQQQGPSVPRSSSRGSLHRTGSGGGSMPHHNSFSGSFQGDAHFPGSFPGPGYQDFSGGFYRPGFDSHSSLPRQGSNLSELSRHPSSGSMTDSHRHRRQASGSGLEGDSNLAGLHRPPPKGHRRSQSVTLEGRTSLPRHLSRGDRTVSAESIQGKVIEMSRDQSGSRTVQQVIEHPDSSNAQQVYEELQSQALSLMTDQFGNYVIQKLLDHGGPKMRSQLGAELQGRILELTVDTFGCRIVQKAFEVLDFDDRIGLARELQDHVLACIGSQHGNHVMQKLIECVQPSDAVDFVTQELLHGGGQPLPVKLTRSRSAEQPRSDVAAEPGVVALSKHTYGCRVVQRLLEFCTLQSVREVVLKDILDNCVALASNTMGNYVIQHVVQHGSTTKRRQAESTPDAEAENASYSHTVIQALMPHMLDLTCNKFGSNVVEECLKNSSAEDRQAILGSFLASFSADPSGSTLCMVLRDSYGNYVAQRLLEWATEEQIGEVRGRLQDQLDKPTESGLRKHTHAKHFFSALAAREKSIEAGHAAPASQAPQPASQVSKEVADAVARAL